MTKRIPTVLALSVAVSAAGAKCIANDAWTGPDKVKHFGAGAAAGAAGTLVFKDARKGLLLGVAVGAAKEVYDTRGHGTCSLQDFAVTALGAAAGAYGTAWIVTPRFVGYARTF